MHRISGCVMATNMNQVPTVRELVCLKQKQLWSETDQQNLHIKYLVAKIWITCMYW